MINLFKPIAFFAIFLSIAVPASANAVFPTVTSEDLNGDSHTLPQGFPGEPTIVFIAYKQRQQGDVNSWIYALNLDPSSGPEFVELPVVGSAMVAMKGVIDNGMRSGIVDRNMRARTITMGAFTTVLGVLPLYLDAFFQSMTVVIAAGLSFATLITLLVTPVLYALLFGIRADEVAA